MLNVRTGTTAALLVVCCATGGCRKPAAAGTQEPAAQAASAAPAAGQAAAVPPASQAPASSQEPATGKLAAPPKPVPEVLPAILAKVNGEPVRKADFDRRLKQVETQAGRSVPKERRNEIYRALLDQIVTQVALWQESRARGLTVSDVEAKQAADAKIAELHKQVPDKKEFAKRMAARNMTLELLRADIRKDLDISKLIAAELATAPPITDAQVREFYDKNPDEFSGVRASHILIRPEGFDEASKNTARTAAEAVLKQAKAGTDFAELAKKHSSDGSAQQGGDLGFFTKKSMVPEVSKAAFALQPGQVSDVVETQFGFHLIKVAERKDIPFEEATPKIREFLSEKQPGERQQASVAQVKSKSRIEVFF
jgi:peptidyl-prolyl cis-trans isomerase C